MAQASAPVSCMKYTSEKYLYIQGGFTAVATIRTQSNQLIVLDLTVPTWPTSNPPWLFPSGDPAKAIDLINILTLTWRMFSILTSRISLFTFCEPFEKWITVECVRCLCYSSLGRTFYFFEQSERFLLTTKNKSTCQHSGEEEKTIVHATDRANTEPIGRS